MSTQALASLRVEDLIDPAHCPLPELLENTEYAWEILPRIASALDQVQEQKIEGEISEHAHIGERVWIGNGATVAAGATIQGPAIIGENCQVRAGALIRDNVIVGKGATLGNSSEFKNTLIGDGAEIPHFNYVGDSVLGYKAHLGAGAILSNVRLDRKNVTVLDPAPDSNKRIDTGLRKFGAIIGDLTEVGCNAVISPGSILGKECLVYPCAHWQGALASSHIVKLRQQTQIVERR